MKYRPWGFEEIPVGNIVRWKDSGNHSRRIITGVIHGDFIEFGPHSLSPEQMLDLCVMDNGLPCGVKLGVEEEIE